MYDMRDWLVSGKPCKAEEYELLESCWQVAGKPSRLILSLWNLFVFFAKGIRCLAIFEQWPYDVHSAIDWFFPASFSWYLQMLRNPGEIVDSTVQGTHEASSNWLRLVVHSELEHSYLSTRHAGCPCVLFSTLLNGFFYRSKKQNFTLQGMRFYSMTFTGSSSQPIKAMSWDGQNGKFLVMACWLNPHESFIRSQLNPY